MKVAVVGSGVSGLAATWVCGLSSLIQALTTLTQLLNEYSEHEVHLYEADGRPGGHANTVKFTPPGKQSKDGVYVDT
jgi:predicted NAD/FAD-binding protein